jgi:diacylglycerol kinase
MLDVRSPDFAPWLIQLLVSAFLAVLFLQSGIDKLVDRRGNREYLEQHFAKSPLAGTVGPMFLVITLLEVSAGVLSGIGCLVVLLAHNPTIAFLGAVIASVNLIALFFGQRIAKDYAGAAALVPYFLLALSGVYFLAGL